MRTLNLSIVHRALSTVNLLGALSTVNLLGALLFFVSGTLHAQAEVIPHPFTVGKVFDEQSADQVPYAVYFSAESIGRQTWKEDYGNGQRLLTASEWNYVFTEREINARTADQLRGFATIIKNGGDPQQEEDILELGLVLLPDDWGYTHYYNNNAWYADAECQKLILSIGTTYDNNVYTVEQLTEMQQAGAMFLPSVTADKIYGSGDYWSSTKKIDGISFALFQTSRTTPSAELFQINTGGEAEEARFVCLVQDHATITLNETTKNIDLLRPWKTNEQAVNVHLIRSLTTGMYNTFCLPFDLTEQEVKETFGEEAMVAKFTSGALSEDKQALIITFENCTTIEAGIPYLIQPVKGMSNPTFYNRVIKDTTASGENFAPQGKVEYLGIINPYRLTPGDKRYLFLQANNNLIWSKQDDVSSMKGMRGYFYVPDMQDMPANCPARLSIRQPQTPTDIGESSTPSVGEAQCIKLMHDGNLYIKHNGIIYNVQGGRER